MASFVALLRDSPLSLAQGAEIASLLEKFGHKLTPLPKKTYGDLDKNSSLRDMESTDFFTRELHQGLLEGEADLAIHSAKDLEPNLPKGLEVIALTEGVRSEDALVLREGEELSPGMLIATSSKRREDAALLLGVPLRFRDVRGTIGERLALLEKGEADGVIIAEAALIRLGLTHLNRLILPGETAPLQGKLAIVAKKERTDLKELFAPLDTGRVLWTGLRPPPYAQPFPLIEIKRIDAGYLAVKEQIGKASHLILTSQTAAELLKEVIPEFPEIIYLSVGKKTTELLLSLGAKRVKTAEIEEAEGVVELLKEEEISYLLYPRSARGREVIPEALKERNISHATIDLYETLFAPRKELPRHSEIVFTSPSTVDAYIDSYHTLPHDKKLTAIGRITKNHLKERQHDSKV